MNHTVDTCALTKSDGSLRSLHDVTDGKLDRLETAATEALTK